VKAQSEESWERKVERVTLAEAELVRYRQKVQAMLDELMKYHRLMAHHKKWQVYRKSLENGPS